MISCSVAPGGIFRCQGRSNCVDSVMLLILGCAGLWLSEVWATGAAGDGLDTGDIKDTLLASEFER
jgi:hypothetical protein